MFWKKWFQHQLINRRKNNTTFKSHFSDATAHDSIVPPIFSYIDQGAKFSDQRVPKDLNLRHKFTVTDQLNQPIHTTDFFPSKNFSKSSIDTLLTQPYFHRKSNNVGTIEASVCPYCNSSDCNNPITCSQYQLFQQFCQSDHSDNLRLDSTTDSCTFSRKALSLRCQFQLHDHVYNAADAHDFPSCWMPVRK